MDREQNNHLKAYGLTYVAIESGLSCKWLLNYRGGSFLLPYQSALSALAAKKGVTAQKIDDRTYLKIQLGMENKNMAEVKLEKSPKIAVYTRPNNPPWADAVTLVLEYAEIPYGKIYDTEVLDGTIQKYDWLHLHHEDFTGQFSRFWASYRNRPWFREEVATYEKNAKVAGFKTVWQHKLAVAQRIQLQVSTGLFLFAMCTATETFDIALASGNTDIVPAEIDKTPIDPTWKSKMDFNKTMAFQDFNIHANIYINSFSDIDFNQVNTPNRKETKDFILFEFSAKLDPIPTLLCQNHNNRIAGFFGQTTSFSKSKLKDGVTLLAESINKSAKYIHGNYGEGTFTFYGGHAPDDKNHYVGDSAPNMELHKNSPGYRLILNNILFPSAKPPKKKT